VSSANSHAVLWSGTAESCVDLSTLLPADYGDSGALDIEVTNTDIWVVGWAIPSPDPSTAVLWHKSIPYP
jgi:hypothetical protein